MILLTLNYLEKILEELLGKLILPPSVNTTKVKLPPDAAALALFVVHVERGLRAGARGGPRAAVARAGDVRGAARAAVVEGRARAHRQATLGLLLDLQAERVGTFTQGEDRTN